MRATVRRAAVAASLLALVLAAVSPAAASVAEAQKLELVANVPYLGGTHLSFVQKVVAGVTRTYALAGAADGLRIVDVTPDGTGAIPLPLGVTFRACAQGPNDVGVSPDGNTLLLNVDSNFSGAASKATGCTVPGAPAGYGRIFDVGLVDITDIAAPKILGTPLKRPDGSTWPALKGVHTTEFVPGHRIAYLSTQETPDRTGLSIMPILDLRGAAPDVKLTQVLPVGSSPHDITFSADGTRAYVAAVTATYVLDTTDPMNPTGPLAVIADPAISIHHESFLTPNGRYLLIVDEQAGAITNVQCPGGGVHVYDLGPNGEAEAAPVKVGVFFADDTRTVASANLPACTAHEGGFSADGRTLSLGWYDAGTRIFDIGALDGSAALGDPVGLEVTEVAFLRPTVAETWVAKTHPAVPGYVFANDAKRGFDVYRITAPLT